MSSASQAFRAYLRYTDGAGSLLMLSASQAFRVHRRYTGGAGSFCGFRYKGVFSLMCILVAVFCLEGITGCLGACFMSFKI